MDELPAETWHELPGAKATTALMTDPDNGLVADEAVARLARYGRNELTRRRGQGPLIRFLLQFHQPLVYILLAAGGVTLALGEFVDSAVIVGVVLVNAVIGFVQEAKALTAIEALARTLVTETTVIRSGNRVRIPAAELVPGDIVVLQSGDKVPADLRLLRVRDLRIAEASLTGESVPSEKQPDPLPSATPLADRSNMAYATTLVTYGGGTGVVAATGERTEVGRISQLIATADNLATPLTRRIAKFSKVLLVLILGLAIANFAIGLAHGLPTSDMFMASVALAVAAIPEGLPAAVTIVLAIGVTRMAKRRAVVRKLPAVETLGSTTVICSDKTGTLTQNQMTVAAIVAGGELFEVSGVGYAPEGDVRGPMPNGQPVSTIDLHGRVALLECLRAGLLCNDATLAQTVDGWDIQGDPTEGALVVAALKAGLDETVLREEWPRIDAIPFESEYQYMATLHDRGAGLSRVVYVKGSVEALLRRCNHAVDTAGHASPLQPEMVYATVAELAGRGLRVLALAYKVVPDETTAIAHSDIGDGLAFLGLQAMIDPPRPEAIRAVSACQVAGVRVKMITGDHALTASAVARQLGLKSEKGGPEVVTGAELSVCPDTDLPALADRAAVFARVAPEQKLRLVKALQARGHVVAMTGDGVNDAPALKQADIGVAMGRGGTDVARESADMVLTDDNFATIEAAVEEGRSVLDNLTKFIVWTLPTNIGEGLVVLMAVLLGTTLPISPVQILWINMLTAVTLGLMLAFEPKETGIMARPPRDPHARLLSVPLMKRIGLVSLLLLAGAFGLFKWTLWGLQGTVEEARTVAVNVFVFGELFYLFNCRSLTRSIFRIGLFTNPAAIGGSLGMILLQLAFTYAPSMNRLFGTAPIGLAAWGAILLVGLVLYLIVEAEKRLVGHVLLGVPASTTSTSDHTYRS